MSALDGTWNREGTILFSRADGLHRVEASGGVPRQVTAVSSSEILHYGTAFLPDGDRFLYVAQSGEGVQAVYTATLERPGVPVRLLQSGSQAIYVPPWNGHPAFLLFRSGPALMAQPVDGALRVKGSPIRVADDVATVTGRFGPAFFSAGGATIAYRGPDEPDRAALAGYRRAQSLRLSPDGQYAAFSATDRGGNEDVWVLEFRRGVETRLTTGPSADYSPAWSPDGRQIAFISERDGVTRVYRMSSGGGAEESLAEGWQVRDWSRDGRHLLFGRMGPATGNDFLALPLTASGAGKPVPIAQPVLTNQPPAFLRTAGGSPTSPTSPAASRSMCSRSPSLPPATDAACKSRRMAASGPAGEPMARSCSSCRGTMRLWPRRSVSSRTGSRSSRL